MHRGRARAASTLERILFLIRRPSLFAPFHDPHFQIEQALVSYLLRLMIERLGVI